MEAIFYVILGLLFLLAISDLVVGVSNDAVNFLSSAVGSKATSFRIILVIAGLGVLIGAIFSNGMMEVARKGLFHPEMFMFSEIMLIFLAVMMTDILLLDFFNTIGIPTSTTVSLVFEILGAAVSMALIKITISGDAYTTLGNYINSDKALAIITGILVSVVIAFSIGALIQYLSRILFTFSYEKKMKYFAGIFGGLAITGIVYFILIKGLKDSSVVSKDTYKFIEDYTLYILLVGFLFFGGILQLMYTFFKTNVLKIIVLVGTFALAMAFAGNDLVNFIGVPIAGFKSFQIFQAQQGVANPDTFAMGELNAPVQTDLYMLLIAGLVMMATLWLSKKARTVLETSVQLSKQDSKGKEQFGSSFLARIIVQGATDFGKKVGRIVPKSFSASINKRFEQEKVKKEDKKNIEDKPAFDMVRAAVNTLVASFLIAIGTSLKLPLSTTYVTFMVAMGSSMADRAWGRDTAVYRITGVLTVVASWFFTAFIAFMAAAIVLFILKMGGVYGLGFMILLSLFLLIRAHKIHKLKSKNKANEAGSASRFMSLTPEKMFDSITETAIVTLKDTNRIFQQSFEALFDEDRKNLKKLNKEVSALNKITKAEKEKAYQMAESFPEHLINIGNMNIQLQQNVREITYCLNYITPPAFLHVNNVHNPLSSSQQEDLRLIISQMSRLYEILFEGLKVKSIDHSLFETELGMIQESLEKYRLEQIKRAQEDLYNSRTSLLYLSFLHECGNMANHMHNLVITCKRTHDVC